MVFMMEVLKVVGGLLGPWVPLLVYVYWSEKV